MAESLVVLIVEDEAPIAEVIAMIVEDLGATPIVAVNGLQALERVQERRPALIVTDIMMPKMSGIEFIGALRAELLAYGHPIPPIIVMSAGDLSTLHTLQVQAILPKPFEVVTLEAMLRDWLAL